MIVYYNLCSFVVEGEPRPNYFHRVLTVFYQPPSCSHCLHLIDWCASVVTAIGYLSPPILPSAIRRRPSAASTQFLQLSLLLAAALWYHHHLR